VAELGRELRRLREDRGWSLREASEHTDGVVSHTYLGHLERGKDPRTNKPVAPSPPILKALATAYGVGYEYLMELAGYWEPGKVEAIEEEWPEGVQFLRRASQKLTPEMKRKMIRAMKQFLEDDDPDPQGR